MDVPLAGGYLSGAVRREDTVRRRMGPWTPAVHGLLAHLRAQGFTACPELLDVDGEVEVLRWMPGEVLTYPPAAWFWAANVPADCARMLRELQDAMSGFELPSGASWSPLWPTPGPPEVLCHGDFSPCNLLFVDAVPRAVIDFDFAGPGPRLWDVASAAYRVAPLHAPGTWERWEVPPPDVETVRRRLRDFLARLPRTGSPCGPRHDRYAAAAEPRDHRGPRSDCGPTRRAARPLLQLGPRVAGRGEVLAAVARHAPRCVGHARRTTGIGSR